MMVPKDFNDLAVRRTAVVLKNGVNFDRSLRDMLSQAYTFGFIDCYEISAEEKKILKNVESVVK